LSHVVPPFVPAFVRRPDLARGVPTRGGGRPDDQRDRPQQLLLGPDRPRDDLGIRGRPLGPRGHPFRDLELEAPAVPPRRLLAPPTRPRRTRPVRLPP